MTKIGRNEPCPCGSGLKYKKCHGTKANNPYEPKKSGSNNIPPKVKKIIEQRKARRLKKLDPNKIPPEVKKIIEQQKAQEHTRKEQQGLGKPIISVEHSGYRFVAVGNKLHYSENWKTFHDFLLAYVRIAMGSEWGNLELKKPLEERHPILQWYDKVCKFQQDNQTKGVVSSAPMTGVMEAYLHFAYNLYLMGHNTIKDKFSQRLQDRLIERLKITESFPGTYYETYVCAWLILAGFEVEFEDEEDPSVKHCDFNVKCKASNNKYTVEAKSIRREGALGASENTTGASLTKSIRNQLHDALSKPSDYPRIIFIDVNLPDNPSNTERTWMDEATVATREAENLTVNKKDTDQAYIFLTNIPHHYHPDEINIVHGVLTVGYKIEDFGDGIAFNSMRDAYYAKKKHIDIYNIMESQKNHNSIPSTFDGSLPSETFYNHKDRIIIGETYNFGDTGEDLIAKVTTATVNKTDKTILIGTDKGQIFTKHISDEELEDYEKHPDTYFGIIYTQGRESKTYYELFEFFLESYLKTPKEKLLNLMKHSSEIEHYKTLPQKELAIIYSEGVVQTIIHNNENKKNEQR